MAMQPNSRFKPCLVSPTGSGERQAPTVHLDGTWLDRLTCRSHSRGGVAERLKAAVLKTAGPQGLAGSNPASSANPDPQGWTKASIAATSRPSGRLHGTDAKVIAE